MSKEITIPSKSLGVQESLSFVYIKVLIPLLVKSRKKWKNIKWHG
ncbi:hypothetical protein [Winogradskyella sp. UBA3174]|nr:hypothetical protein [Winogradskyella sp. UBA3174]